MAKVKVKKMKSEDWGEDFGKRMESKFKHWHYHSAPGIGIPLLLVLIGIYLIGRDLGWWYQTINIWGLILLVIGVYWLLKRVLNR